MMHGGRLAIAMGLLAEASLTAQRLAKLGRKRTAAYPRHRLWRMARRIVPLRCLFAFARPANSEEA